MSKASDARTLPEVARNGDDETSQVYDFLQSEDWQQVLENARIQREKNLAARGQESKEKPVPNPGNPNIDHSTAGEHSPGPRHLWDRLEDARRQRESVLAGRKAEAEKSDTGESGASDDNKSNEHVKDKGGASSEVGQQGERVTGPEQSDQEKFSTDANPSWDENVKENKGIWRVFPAERNSARGKKAKGSQRRKVNPGLGANISAEDATKKVRRKLLRSWSGKQRTSKTKLSAVALGCAIGVLASSATFFVLSKWDTLGGRENAVLESQGTESSEIVTLQGESSAPSEARTPNASAVSAPQYASSPIPPEIPPASIMSDENLIEPVDSKVIAAALLPLPEMNEGTEVAEPVVPSVAPYVRSNLTALEQPQSPTVVTDVQTRPEAISGFVQYPWVPLILDPAILSPQVAAIQSDPIDFLTDVSVLSPRPPDVTYQPISLTSGEEYKSLLHRALAYQPSSEGAVAFPARPNFSSVLTLAVLNYADPPEVPIAIVPNLPELTTVSTTPSIETENPVPNPREVIQDQLPPPIGLPESAISLATPNEDVEPVGTTTRSGGAEFRLFAPDSVAVDAVNSVVASLAQTGHELRGSARVGFGIKQSNVRFYHRQDAPQARALAEDAGALLRDFTGAKSKTPIGVVELWLEGKSVAKPRVKKARRSTTSESRTNQLRRQVLSKLKTTTNQ